MIYKIVWKRKNTIYTEYLDIVGLKSCLDYLEKSNDSELVSITPNKE